MNKNILIIGSSGNIGNTIAKKLYDEGYNLGLHFNKNSYFLKKNFKKKNVKFLKMSFSNEKNAINLINNFLKKFKKIDGIIIASGLLSWRNIKELEVQDFNKSFLVNSIIPFFLMKHSIIKMEPGSKIIVLSSISVKYFGSAKTIEYAASKAALESLSMSINKECVKKKIILNILRPGFVDSKLQKKGRAKKDIIKRIKMIPHKRAVQPIDIANTVSFLMKESTKNISGQIITISAGE